MNAFESFAQDSMSLVKGQPVVMRDDCAKSPRSVIHKGCGASQDASLRKTSFKSAPKRARNFRQSTGKFFCHPKVTMLRVAKETIVAAIARQDNSSLRANCARDSQHAERRGAGERLG